MFKKTLIDLHAEIDLPRPFYYPKDLEACAKILESDAEDLTAFIRDHRSRDRYQIEIVREYKSICQFCFNEEERDDSGCPVCCGRAIEEFDNSKAVKIEQTKS